MWRCVEDRRAGRAPAEWFAIVWNAAYGNLVEAIPGDPKHQASWEALCLLLASLEWIRDSPGPATLVGDAEGILYDLVQLRGKSTVINDVAKELALHLAPQGRELIGLHIWGAQNKLADELSRVAEKGETTVVKWLKECSTEVSMKPPCELGLKILGSRAKKL